METEFRPDYAVHPGVLLKEEIEDLGLTQKAVSVKAGISKTVINEIIKGKRSINADLAVRLESVLESPARFWLNLQSLYDETMARLKLNKENPVGANNVNLIEEAYPAPKVVDVKISGNYNFNFYQRCGLMEVA